MTEAMAPPGASFLATRKGQLTLAFLCLVAFMDFMGFAIMTVALPTIQRDLHFSQQNLQWVISGYTVTYGGFLLLGGRLADLLGRRVTLVTGTAVFAITSVLGGAAPNAGTLVGAGRAAGHRRDAAAHLRAGQGARQRVGVGPDDRRARRRGRAARRPDHQRNAAPQPGAAAVDLPDQGPSRHRCVDGAQPGRAQLRVLLHLPLHAEIGRAHV